MVTSLRSIALLCGACLATLLPPAGVQAQPAAFPTGSLEQAQRNYPPLIMSPNIRPTDGAGPFARSCPAAGARVEQVGGPPFEYLGASPTNPDLCRMRIGTDTVEGWYGIWLTDWPGAAAARPALQRVIQGRTGTVEAFDTVAAPNLGWHDLIRNEGIEDIRLLDGTYTALKLSHYREGLNGNTYRSVSTVWKDMATGMVLYGTYQHISGAPVIDGVLLPTRIVPAR